VSTGVPGDAKGATPRIALSPVTPPFKPIKNVSKSLSLLFKVSS
jgi:hypothetical protein